MREIDACGLTLDLIGIEGNLMNVGSVSYDLSEVGDIYVLGAGKAVLQIAEALEDVLGHRIKSGAVVEKRLSGMPRGLERIGKFKKIEVLEGDHPVPDEAAVRGAERILELASRAGSKDLVFFCVQGGCTCLTTLPADGLSLDDVRETTKILLDSGLEIKAVNLIRSAVTKLSHGRLARYIHPAQIVNIVVKDAVWDFGQDPRTVGHHAGWGPTVPVEDFVRIEPDTVVSTLKKHGLFGKIPASVRRHLSAADPNSKLPARVDFERAGIRYRTFILADPEDSAEAAKRASEAMGLDSMILSSNIEGEAREIGSVFAGIAKEISKNGRPLRPPCLIIASGETTVKIAGEPGEGGPNQEVVLSAALKLDGANDVVIASIGTDGTDGPTGIAGGIVDGRTVQRARQRGIDIFENLKGHNSSPVLRELGDAILFNEPGNNVCDLTLIIVTDRT
jgi:glycerate-2-kinase